MAKELDDAVESFRTRPLDGCPYTYIWLDALTQKVREDGRIVNVAALVATGVNAAGFREILGLDLVTSEDGAVGSLSCARPWPGVFRGVRLVISDAHPGLVDAIASTLPGATWQRCRTHFLRNLLAKVSKSAGPFVATLVRSIFAQPDAEAVWAQFHRVVEQLGERFPAAAQVLADAGSDILAFTTFPQTHWKQIWSNNPQERLNKEIRRRTDALGSSPTAQRRSAWSGWSWPNNRTSGRSCAAT
jgi:transposase-like protein